MQKDSLRIIKYTRENAGTVKGNRGDLRQPLTEKDYELLDTLGEIAHELDTTRAAVALAWVQGRPGVTSTIIGARTRKQLDENLTALDLQLSPAHVAALDHLSEPTLNFPSQIVRTFSLNVSHAGATVNGVPSTVMFPSLLSQREGTIVTDRSGKGDSFLDHDHRTSSFPTFSHLDRLVDLIEGERAIMR